MGVCLPRLLLQRRDQLVVVDFPARDFFVVDQHDGYTVAELLCQFLFFFGDATTIQLNHFHRGAVTVCDRQDLLVHALAGATRGTSD